MSLLGLFVAMLLFPVAAFAQPGGVTQPVDEPKMNESAADLVEPAATHIALSCKQVLLQQSVLRPEATIAIRNVSTQETSAERGFVRWRTLDEQLVEGTGGVYEWLQGDWSTKASFLVAPLAPDKEFTITSRPPAGMCDKHEPDGPVDARACEFEVSLSDRPRTVRDFCWVSYPGGQGGDCGFGPELAILMPALLWLHRRRLRSS